MIKKATERKAEAMEFQTSEQAMENHSFFADRLNKKAGNEHGKGNKSFIPWLVSRVGGRWNDPHLVVDFSKIHISPEILEVWKREAKKDPSLPDLDKVPGIKLMKKDLSGFMIRVDEDCWKDVRNVSKYYR